MLEEKIEAYFVERCKALGWMALKGDVKGRRFLDRIVIADNGVTAYVELKRPKRGYLTLHQGEIIKRLAALGHCVYTPNTKAAVDETVERIRKQCQG